MALWVSKSHSGFALHESDMRDTSSLDKVKNWAVGSRKGFFFPGGGGTQTYVYLHRKKGHGFFFVVGTLKGDMTLKIEYPLTLY